MSNGFQPPEQFNQWGNPEGQPASQNPYAGTAYGPPGYGNVPYRSPQTSVMAILSLISGIMAIPFMCCQVLGFPLALFAVVSGHVSRSIIRQSNGTVTGSGMAITGLITGYLGLMFSATVLGVIIWSAQQGGGGRSTTFRSFLVEPVVNEATEFLGDDGVSPGEGRTAEARRLATHYAEAVDAALLPLLPEFDVPAAESKSASADPDVSPELPAEPIEVVSSGSRVWCLLNDNTCILFVRIARLDEVDESDYHRLQQILWLVARQSLGDLRDEGTRLAVVIVAESSEVSDVGIGIHDLSEEFEAGLTSWGNDANDLAPLLEESLGL